MSHSHRPISLTAQRAVRFLREHGGAAGSLELAAEILATRVPDETIATRVLEAAFAGDSRLAYLDGVWRISERGTDQPLPPSPPRHQEVEPDPDRVLLLLDGLPQTPTEPFRLTSVSAMRLQGDNVVAACGGDPAAGVHGNRLRRSILQTLVGAIPIIHDPPGAIAALEKWLGEPLPSPISLRGLAREREGLGSQHDLETLVAHLGLAWRETEDPLEMADTLDACLRQLREPGERLVDLQIGQREGAGAIDWSRFDFDREILRALPSAPGTYRFFDRGDHLIYVGKAKNLSRRIASYFRETGPSRSPRVQKLLDALYRIEYEIAGSDLEAMLREAEQIRGDRPAENVQRNVHARGGRTARLLSILILEPAEPPSVLRAYLIREGRLVGRVSIGPRGGGLTRIERVLDDHFFSTPIGPTTIPGPDLDVEVVARWLAANRDGVVAFDPTDLRTSQEVIERLRWFLDQGSPFEPDGAPIFRR